MSSRTYSLTIVRGALLSTHEPGDFDAPRGACRHGLPAMRRRRETVRDRASLHHRSHRLAHVRVYAVRCGASRDPASSDLTPRSERKEPVMPIGALLGTNAFD